MLHARLQERKIAAPAAIAAALRNNYLASAARNLRLFHELGGILEALRAGNVPVIPLKGACLAETVYGDTALRPMFDLDLLVRSRDLAQGMRVLRTCGFESDRAPNEIEGERAHLHAPRMSSDTGVVVEMHWTIMDPAARSRFTADELEAVWSRATPATIANAPAATLAPTDLLLHLCLHASVQHRFDGIRLRNLLDIAEVAEKLGAAIDWHAFADRANRWGVANGVHLTLALAGEWTDFGCPAGVLNALRAEPLDDETKSWATRKVLDGDSRRLDSDVTLLEAGRGLDAKIRSLCRAAFPSRQAMARMYPSASGSRALLARYPIRWKDLWVRYGGVLWKLATRDREFVADAQSEARLREYLGRT